RLPLSPPLFPYTTLFRSPFEQRAILCESPLALLRVRQARQAPEFDQATLAQLADDAVELAGTGEARQVGEAALAVDECEQAQAGPVESGRWRRERRVARRRPLEHRQLVEAAAGGTGAHSGSIRWRTARADSSPRVAATAAISAGTRRRSSARERARPMRSTKASPASPRASVQAWTRRRRRVPRAASSGALARPVAGTTGAATRCKKPSSSRAASSSSKPG